MILTSGCALSVNVYLNFPEEQLGEKLFEMEKNIRTQDQSRNNLPFDLFAYAQPQDSDKIELDVNTPAIKKINERRKKRFKQIEKYFEDELIGEGNDANLYERPKLDDLELKEKSELRKTIKEENNDRDELIKEIAKENGLKGEENLKKIRNIYAKQLKKLAKVGWWLQNKDGEWYKKEERKKEDKEEEE